MITGLSLNLTLRFRKSIIYQKYGFTFQFLTTDIRAFSPQGLIIIYKYFICSKKFKHRKTLLKQFNGYQKKQPKNHKIIIITFGVYTQDTQPNGKIAFLKSNL